MTIQSLKESIVNKTYVQDFLIMTYADTDFIPMQYLNEIKKITGMELFFIDEQTSIPKSNGFFDSPIYVIRADKITSCVSYNKNVIYITKEVSKDVEEQYKNYVVQFPKIEGWMIEDYVKGYCEGLSDSSAKWVCNKYRDLYCITNELDKIKVFPTEMRESLFNTFSHSGVLIPTESETLVNLSRALQARDNVGVYNCLRESSEIEPMQFVSFLYTSFKNIIRVWMNKNPTTENTGLKSNQIYAISKLNKVFEKSKLIEIFNTLSGIDEKIKSGVFPIELVIDYIIIEILS